MLLRIPFPEDAWGTVAVFRPRGRLCIEGAVISRAPAIPHRYKRELGGDTNAAFQSGTLTAAAYLRLPACQAPRLAASSALPGDAQRAADAAWARASRR